jgi:L-lactate dehydrogenase complex protein LldG
MDTQIAEVVAAALKARNKARVIIPPALPSEWLPSDIEFIRDRGMTYEQLDRSEGVLTPCVAVAALTGTIFLCHSEQHGRRALTLIPDYHLCLVFEDQIFETVPEAMRAVAPFATSPITAISGPSATSDIEMTRIKGVHGPRSLDVIVLARS